MEFLVIDFEYANANHRGSICQIGLIDYKDGKLTILMDSLVDPIEEFSATCVSAHHITEDMVDGAPVFPEFHGKLYSYINGKVIFTQNGADKTILEAACKHWSVEMPECIWLNSTSASKRAWPELNSHRLGNVCDMLNIKFQYHNAAEDAMATAKMIIKATEKTGYDLDKWIKEIEVGGRSSSAIFENFNEQRISGNLLKAPDLEKVENKDTLFYGKKVVVSGKYVTWPDRKDLVKILKELGADIDSSVGKYTDILCAGVGVGPSKMKKMQAKENGLVLNEIEILNALG